MALRRTFGRAFAIAFGLVTLAWAVLSIVVQFEAPYVHESLGGSGPARALVLYHPSRDAHFSDDLSLAVAEGLKSEGLAVERATMTSATPAAPESVGLIAVVTNTYYWAPDAPTMRYLERASFAGVTTIGVVGGAGTTGRAVRLLDAALRHAGGHVLGTRAFWLWRPNDEGRLHESNRAVGLERARAFAAEAARAARSE